MTTGPKGVGMSEATLENEADAIAYGVCPIQHAPAAECVTCDAMSEAIRAAVAAKQEEIKALHQEFERERRDSQRWILEQRGEIERLREALEKVKECCSPFDLDPLQRALNAVEHCQEIARAALHTEDAEGGGDE